MGVGMVLALIPRSRERGCSFTLGVYPIFGRALKAHDEVKFLIAQMVRQCGVANVAPTEVRLSGPARNYDCDVAYFDRKTHKRVVLEIVRVAITQASISGSGVLAGPDAVLSILRAHERERRRLRPLTRHSQVENQLSSCIN